MFQSLLMQILERRNTVTPWPGSGKNLTCQICFSFPAHLKSVFSITLHKILFSDLGNSAFSIRNTASDKKIGGKSHVSCSVS
jgi:hypothetical protein